MAICLFKKVAMNNDNVVRGQDKIGQGQYTPPLKWATVEMSDIAALARELVEATQAIEQEIFAAGQRGDLRTNDEMPSWPRFASARQAWMELPRNRFSSPPGSTP